MKKLLTIQVYTIDELDEDTRDYILERFINEYCDDLMPNDWVILY